MMRLGRNDGSAAGEEGLALLVALGPMPVADLIMERFEGLSIGAPAE